MTEAAAAASKILCPPRSMGSMADHGALAPYRGRFHRKPGATLAQVQFEF